MLSQLLWGGGRGALAVTKLSLSWGHRRVLLGQGGSRRLFRLLLVLDRLLAGLLLRAKNVGLLRNRRLLCHLFGRLDRQLFRRLIGLERLVEEGLRDE